MEIIVLGIYVFVALVFLCIWSTERACGTIDESLLFVVAMSLLWPIMLFHVIPFGLRCLFDSKTWRD